MEGLELQERKTEEGVGREPRGIEGQPAMQVAQPRDHRIFFNPADGLGVIQAGVKGRGGSGGPDEDK